MSLCPRECSARAEELVRKAVQHSPDNTTFWITLGHICQQNGRDEEAERSFVRTLDLDLDGPSRTMSVGASSQFRGHGRNIRSMKK
jgi:Flp pilus assembly protein TadD